MKVILQLALDATLYLLALPVFLIQAALRWAAAKLPTTLDHGVITCPWCNEGVPTARMNRCACGFVSPSSLVAPCANCGEGPFPFIECPNCGGTLKVL